MVMIVLWTLLVRIWVGEGWYNKYLKQERILLALENLRLDNSYISYHRIVNNLYDYKLVEEFNAEQNRLGIFSKVA